MKNRIQYSHKKFKTNIKSYIRFEKVHRVIKLIQKVFSKILHWYGYKAKKKSFENDISKPMKNSVFGKSIKNFRKHRDIKLVTVEQRRNYLVTETKYHTKNI